MLEGSYLYLSVEGSSCYIIFTSIIKLNQASIVFVVLVVFFRYPLRDRFQRRISQYFTTVWADRGPSLPLVSLLWVLDLQYQFS